MESVDGHKPPLYLGVLTIRGQSFPGLQLPVEVAAS